MRKFETSGIKVKIFNFLNLRTFRLNPHCMWIKLSLKFKEYLQKSMIRLRLINWVIYTLILYFFACNSRQDKLMVIYSKNCRILEGHTHSLQRIQYFVILHLPNSCNHTASDPSEGADFITCGGGDGGLTVGTLHLDPELPEHHVVDEARLGDHNRRTPSCKSIKTEGHFSLKSVIKKEVT